MTSKRNTRRRRSQHKAKDVLANPKLSLLRELSTEQAASVLGQVKQIEKHTFPTNEAMDFTPELLSRSNTSMLVLLCDGNAESPRLIAYAMFVRWQRQLLLHKICVHSEFRRQGNASRVMTDVIARARKTACGAIDLWVDEARTQARNLYAQYGFLEVDRIENYYSVGRAGIKMSLKLDD